MYAQNEQAVQALGTELFNKLQDFRTGALCKQQCRVVFLPAFDFNRRDPAPIEKLQDKRPRGASMFTDKLTAGLHNKNSLEIQLPAEVRLNPHASVQNSACLRLSLGVRPKLTR